MPNTEVVCEVRYHIDQDRLAEFAAYARIWMMLIERYGGSHQGYFVSRQAPVGTTMSFPLLGEEDTELIAIARFSFPDDGTYAQYRSDVQNDPDGIAANAQFRDNPPFKGYKRTFLEKLI